MAKTLQLPPSASSLSESMRDLGYSLESAVADIIDNSITANATQIDIYCVLAGDNPFLSILDNGYGMDRGELIRAMKHGSVNPKVRREPDDLGRFGLGLKTASFSQCRQLTVISAKSGERVAAQWDLNLVDEKDDWLINILNQNEINDFEYVNELLKDGTLVVWQNLDRLFEDLSGKARDETVNQKLAVLERHLSLVFHRYLSGEYKASSKIRISINGHEVVPFDPFCRTNKATQVLPEEKIRIDGDTVKIQPFVLPHHSKLSASEYDFYQDRSDFISNQGAYIYRNGRLMAWGDWFRLIPKGEATKLARVQIDFPNSMDENWTIDIKKSRARPPRPVRERIKQIINQITSRSTRVHRKRGQKLFNETKAPIWERYAEKGSIQYEVNNDHPLVSAFSEQLNNEDREQFAALIKSITASIPYEMIYSDYSTEPQNIGAQAYDEDEITDQLRLIQKTLFPDGSFNAEIFKDVISSTRLFEGRDEIIEGFIKGQDND
ncbi:ATP-binding protein [Kordiimonas pumila]|uniref:ATP-binding protein n=1 Tax=Kordiimonas pumila TaxID=2161677 RepID=A0ABV7D0W8_9PROT|nr:ATP-binding protein [Kordiimonas pumila]